MQNGVINQSVREKLTSNLTLLLDDKGFQAAVDAKDLDTAEQLKRSLYWRALEEGNVTPNPAAAGAPPGTPGLVLPDSQEIFQAKLKMIHRLDPANHPEITDPAKIAQIKANQAQFLKDYQAPGSKNQSPLTSMGAQAIALQQQI